MTNGMGRPRGVYERFFKRALDVVAASALLLVLAPLIALVALGVLFNLGRPIWFVQDRVGRGGTSFCIFKFRTMHPDRRVSREPYFGLERRMTHKSDADPRHTDLGRLLRRFKLDELPQLFNVLGGSMSLIGPRPELVEVARRHSLVHHPRHLVRPGITGVWQLAENRTDLIHEAVWLDQSYVDSLTFRGDLEIAARTVRRAFSRLVGLVAPAGRGEPDETVQLATGVGSTSPSESAGRRTA